MARLASLVSLPSMVLACTLTAVAAEPPDESRQAELRHLLKHDCGSCHGMTMKGGLGPALLPAEIGDQGEESLALVILDGIPGTPMPPWRPLISEADALWLAKLLKSGELQ